MNLYSVSVILSDHKGKTSIAIYSSISTSKEEAIGKIFSDIKREYKDYQVIDIKAAEIPKDTIKQAYQYHFGDK